MSYPAAQDICLNSSFERRSLRDSAPEEPNLKTQVNHLSQARLVLSQEQQVLGQHNKPVGMYIYIKIYINIYPQRI